MPDVEAATKLASIGAQCIYSKTVPRMHDVPNAYSSAGGTAEPDLPPTRGCPAAIAFKIFRAILLLWTNQFPLVIIMTQVDLFVSLTFSLS
jgi:hypothetical protein